MDNAFALTSAQLDTIRRFHGWCMYAPSAYCAVCLQILYPEQVKFYDSINFNDERFPCEDWGRQPMRSWPANWKALDAVYSYKFTAREPGGVIVCSECSKVKPPFEKKALKYPGQSV